VPQEEEAQEPKAPRKASKPERKARKVDLNKMRAARLEKLDPGPILEFGDETFQCPAEVPFAVIEAFARLETADQQQNGEKATAALSDAVRGVLGDQFEKFMALNPSTEDLVAVIEEVFSEYGVDLGELSASPGS